MLQWQRVLAEQHLITRRQLARAKRWRQEVGERWKRLTARERQVLWLLMQGLDNVTIAGELDVMTKTVEWHITKILSKLGVASRLQAAVWGHTHNEQPRQFHGPSGGGAT